MPTASPLPDMCSVRQEGAPGGVRRRADSGEDGGLVPRVGVEAGKGAKGLFLARRKERNLKLCVGYLDGLGEIIEPP